MQRFRDIAEQLRDSEDSAEQERLLHLVFEEAQQFPDVVKSFLQSLDTTSEGDCLTISYFVEAISQQDPDSSVLLLDLWGWVGRLLQDDPKNRKLLAAADSFEFITHNYGSSRAAREIGGGLVAMMVSQHHTIRRLATDLLPSFLGPADGMGARALIEALEDEDWGVRSLARLALRDGSLLPADYTPGVLDRIRDWVKQTPRLY